MYSDQIETIAGTGIHLNRYGLAAGFAVSMSLATFFVSTNVSGADNRHISEAPVAPQLSVADASVSEADGAASIVIRLSETSSRRVTVTAFTRPASAHGGSDYIGDTQSITFAPGETQQSFLFDLRDDLTRESTESMYIGITDAVNATIVDAEGVVTIKDDNDVGGMSGKLSIQDTTVNEADGIARVIVELSEPATSVVTVVAFTQKDDAQPGQDYYGKSETLRFAIGDSEKSLDIVVLNDSEVESSERIRTRIASANGAEIGAGNTGLVTIIDDDDGTTDGGSDGGELTVRRQRQVSNAVDPQPATPALPAIGRFIDMPATDGTVEMTRIVSNPGNNSREHLYARRSSIDPYDRYILTSDFLYHIDDLQEFKRVPFGYEYVAAQTEPDVFYGYRGNVFQKWNAVTDQIVTLYTAPAGMSNYTIGNYEGGLSWDDRYAPLVWQANGGLQITIVDLRSGSVVGSTHSSEVNDSELNWVDLSPTGKYVLVGMNNRVFRYNTDMSGKTTLNTTSGGNAHGDTLYDVAGNEVFAQEGNYYEGQISYTILDSNVNHLLNVVDTASQSGVLYPNSASHISGQARDRQGLLFVSLQHTSGMSNLFATYLVPNQTEVYHYGHTYTRGDTYANSAKASINNSATKIIWTSDWMSGGLAHEFLARQK